MEELVLKAKHGDEKAFNDLILNIQHDLYKIAKMRLINEADIEDAVQETIIEIYESIRSLRDIKAFKPWATKILVNKCNKIYRKKKINEIPFEEGIDNFLVSRADNLEESDYNFYLLIKSLDYEDRMIVTLHYLMGYKIKEISQILKMNENTIKTRMARSKEKLMNDLKEASLWEILMNLINMIKK